MSRLDDELKEAFKRREPAADFTARVMAQIAERQKPKPTLWQRIIDFFSFATMRWTMATAAILLIAAVGFFQYQRLHRGNDSVSAGDKNSGVQEVAKSSVEPNKESRVKVGETSGPITDSPPAVTPTRHRIIRRHTQPRLHIEPGLPRTPEGEVAKDKTHKSEGEIAKEKLYKALEITTNLLQEAKDIVLTGGK